jgi:oligosaccharide translocation protein RFT1
VQRVPVHCLLTRLFQGLQTTNHTHGNDASGTRAKGRDEVGRVKIGAENAKTNLVELSRPHNQGVTFSMASNSLPLPSKETTQGAKLSTTPAGGTTLLIGLQIGSRALTFVVNQLLLRYLSPEIFGISTQLDVYSMSVLFFARESLRLAIQRQSGKSQGTPQIVGKSAPESYVDEETVAGKTQAIVNLAFISIYLGCAFAVFLAWLYLKGVGGSVVQETPYFRAALKIYGMATICELLSEPCFVVIQYRSMYKIRARTEAMATLSRCLATCASAIWASQTDHELGVLPFAIGQAVYALVLLTLYYSNLRSIASRYGFSLMIKPIFSRFFNAICLCKI